MKKVLFIMKPLTFLSILMLLFYPFKTSDAQILNADSYGSKVDSVHQFRGMLDFNFRIRKQIDIILSFGSRADFSYYYKQSLFILVGNFNLIRKANTDLLNSGFAHSRIRLKQDNWLHPEFFGQYQLDGVRGMEHRLLAGANLRFILKEYDKGHFHFGLGAMYEYEHWNYSAVPSTVLVNDYSPELNHYLKLNLYVSYTQKIKDIASWQMAAFLQSRPDAFIIYPRLSVNGMLTFSITKKINFSVRYDVFYDALPPVPIDQLYFTITNRISFNF